MGSAVEREPAQLVAQPLIVEHEISDLARELCALPLTLQAACLLILVLRRCRSRGPDRVGGRSEFVGRHVSHRRGLTCSVRGIPRRPLEVPRRAVCMAGRRPSLGHGDFTTRPGARMVDRPTWTVVLRPSLLEVVQHVLRAVSRPDGEQAVVGVLEAAAATHGDESRVPYLRKDHQLRQSVRHDQDVDIRRARGRDDVVALAPQQVDDLGLTVNDVHGCQSTVLTAIASTDELRAQGWSGGI